MAKSLKSPARVNCARCSQRKLFIAGARLLRVFRFDGIQKRKGARLGAQRPKVKEKAKEKERGFRTAPGNKRPVTGEYYQRLGVISVLGKDDVCRRAPDRFRNARHMI